MDSHSSSPAPLDSEMNYLLSQILNHAYLGVASKHTKIRVNSWLARLECIVSNNIWRKNRNNYYKLLYIMLQCREVIQPFAAMAPEDVPTLHKHQINCILTKLATRLKERERQKENKQTKVLKVDPLDLWNTLEMNCVKSTNAQNRTKCFLNPDTVSRKNNFDSIAFDFLSPISDGAHGRVNSNLSECTYTSIEKCRDLLANCTLNDEPTEPKDQEKQGKESERKPYQEVRYFKKNRSKQCHTQKEVETNNEQLHYKIYSFLRKYESCLRGDIEYRQVMEELSVSLSLPEVRTGGPQSSSDHAHFSGSQAGPNNEEGEDFSLMEMDENSCDYMSGKYSQYSSIQLDSGISPSRIKLLEQSREEEGKKRNDLDSYRNKGLETITTFRKGISVHLASR